MTEYNNYSYIPPQSQKPTKKPLGRAGIIAICAVVSLLFSFIGGALGVYFTKASGGSAGKVVIYQDALVLDKDGQKPETELTVGQIAQAARDSVVEITTEAVSTGSFMMQYVTEGAGSGVIFSKDGYIVTNNHVIDGATNISVRLCSGESYSAKLIGADSRTDLAVIKIDAKDLQSAVLADFENCKLGDTVVAIGNPLGQLGGTVTDGIISALSREITIDNNIMTLIQTNTAINPGNSGGGLFNTSGQLIGIVNAKSAGEDVEGLGFAIPINVAKTVVTDLIEHGYVTGRVDTGIEVIEISDFQSAMYYRVSALGLYVYSVNDKSELRAGDLIKTIDSTEVTTTESFNKIIESHKIGDSLAVKVVRGGKELTLTLVLNEYKPEKTNPFKLN